MQISVAGNKVAWGSSGAWQNQSGTADVTHKDEVNGLNPGVSLHVCKCRLV